MNHFLPYLVLNSSADTLTSELLNKLGFIVNIAHRILICTTCRVCANHTAVASHFKANSHKTPRPKGDFQAELNAELAQILPYDLVFPPIKPTQVVDAVFGLAPPLRDARRCSQCNKWYKGSDEFGPSNAFAVHECATNRSKAGQVIEIANVQQFFSRKGSDRFPVRIPEALPPPTSALAQYQRQRARQSAEEPAHEAMSENHRIFHQFLQKERWIEYLEPYRSVGLFELHQITLKDLDFPRLARHVERYLLDMQDKLQNYLVRRLIGTRPATE